MRTDSSLEVKYAELVGSNGIMEDRIFIGNKSVVVLDGATQADQTIEQTGGWMADQIGQRFSRNIETTGDEIELTELLAQAIADTRDEFNLVPGGSPSTTVCAVRFTKQSADLLVLGDSPIISKNSDTSRLQVLRDDRLSKVSTVIKRPSTVQGQGRKWREHYQSLASMRNCKDGFWIAEADPNAAMHSKTRDALPGSEVVLCTDGVGSVVDNYGLMDWGQLFVGARSPRRLVKKIETIETGDHERRKYPRSKVSDDKLIAAARSGLLHQNL